MILASSANFGIRRTVPHWTGIASGFTLMIVLVGLGLTELFETYSGLETLMKVLCGCFLAYLAWKIATTRTIGDGKIDGRPLTFLQAALFQWVNPKAWAMALTAITLYAPDQSLRSVIVVALAFGAVNLPSMTPWLIAGDRLRGWLSEPVRQKWFNITMAALLLLTMVPLLR